MKPGEVLDGQRQSSTCSLTSSVVFRLLCFFSCVFVVVTILFISHLFLFHLHPLHETFGLFPVEVNVAGATESVKAQD